MRERHLKILFYMSALIMLVSLLFISRDAGISGDEEVHYLHSEEVYEYFATLGKDRDALNTPKTHLQYYGQTPDNMATILIHWLGIEEVYAFRHLFSSFIGWLCILVAGLFAVWLKGYRAGIITLLLFAVSPRFLGHLQNNLKDIPFALAYIAGVFFTLRLTYASFKPRSTISISLLIASIAFSVSIRAGGILLAFYLLFAGVLFYLLEYFDRRQIKWADVQRTFLKLVVFSAAGYLLGLLLWPYALQNPIVNPWESYQVMTDFPTTIRQIFEGEFIWSDFKPWYYLPKYLLITIPLVVFGGLILFAVYGKSIIREKHRLTYFFLIFTTGFPVLWVLLLNSNLYGGWRHFQFIYPGLVILAAVGIHEFSLQVKLKWVKGAVLFLFVLALVHPVRFMVKAHPYYYLYYNPLVGGLNGAYGYYETDYYYHSMRSGAEWLGDYLDENNLKGRVVVGSNFPVDWYLKDHPNLQFDYFQYQFRSDKNWDYAIVGNSYIRPEQLRNGNFPPEGTIHVVEVDDVPVCAVVKRKTKASYFGVEALRNKEYAKAGKLFGEALTHYKKDEHIYYRLGKTLSLQGKDKSAKELLAKALNVNSNYEPALKLMGQLAFKENDMVVASYYFEHLLEVNPKYFSAYVELAKIYDQTQPEKARELLKTCLRINPRYKPAIRALAETYQESHPEIVDKYWEYLNDMD
ncbi:tetratricopeptide repeat protein [uncultured Sunxiuqinia sp.]|uniref:tetratricopeptide repeat protein n=1 Tax=uncultured Sunxiuqinia sp. TaxID=1573825 RepID=UPI00262858C2|nr:tetratricopeptide repeat protein [uncultured Sunxiuqinia sp.]